MSDFSGARGPGKIAGMPEGTHSAAPITSASSGSHDYSVRGSGQLRGMPVGISGKIRGFRSKGRKAAIARVLSTSRLG